MSIRHALFVLLAISTLGCGTSKLIRVVQPEGDSGPPAIDRLVDLGGLPLPAQGELDRNDSDDRITPGEWVAVMGQHLGDHPAVTIDAKPVAVDGYISGGSLLVRIPRGLSARTSHRLEVKTRAGQAQAQFSIVSYVVAANTNGTTLQFLPLSSDSEQLLDNDLLEVSVPEVSLHALSARGNLLYTLERQGDVPESTPGAPPRQRNKLAVVHMGAAKGPRKIGEAQIDTDDPATGLMWLDDTTVALLTERELRLLDVSQPTLLRASAALKLPMRIGPDPAKPPPVSYTDMAAVPDGLLLLEAQGNSLVLVSLGQPKAPRIVKVLELPSPIAAPWSIDVATDPDDPRTAWVLQGPNYRLASTRIRQAADSVQTTLKDWYAWLDKSAAPPVSAPPAAQSVPTESPRAQSTSNDRPRLLKVRTEGDQLTLGEERNLPEGFYPFIVLPRPGGEQLVSGVNSKVFRFQSVPFSTDGLQQLLQVFTDSVELGRIVRLRSGQPPETLVQGMGLYFGIGVLPDQTLLYSVLHPGFRPFPPSFAVNWGIGAGQEDFVLLHRLEWKSMIPPYAVGVFEVQ